MKLSYLLLIAFIYMTSSGCSLTKPVAVTPIHTYTLSGSSQLKSLPPRAIPSTLLINHTLASPGYETPGIAYSQAPFELAYFSRNRWIAPPAQLIHQAMLSSFQQVGSFKAVIGPGIIEPADYRLDTQLLELKHDLQSQPSQVIIKLQAQLINVKKQSLVASQQFTVSTPMSKNNPQAVVMAANQGLSQLFNQIYLFCVESINHYDT